MDLHRPWAKAPVVLVPEYEEQLGLDATHLSARIASGIHGVQSGLRIINAD